MQSGFHRGGGSFAAGGRQVASCFPGIAYCIFCSSFLLTLFATVSSLSCSAPEGELEARRDVSRLYPTPPVLPRVIALGNLGTGRPPGEIEARLAEFLFGTTPEQPLSLMRPASIAVGRDLVFVADDALNAVFQISLDGSDMSAWSLSPPPRRPIAIAPAENGDVLIVDVGGESVLRYAAAGSLVNTYAMDKEAGGFARVPTDRALRPAGCLSVNDEVWVTNVSAHRIEVFDAQTAEFKRSIGRRGAGPGEFAVPLGMARTPEGDVCVVDSLNNRVQVFGADGEWKRIVGRPGDRVGCFGRPKDVAVGPDGTIFVSDAATQRIHAFDPQGRALLAFGEPGRGTGALASPSGVYVSTDVRVACGARPAGFDVGYYVLVCERYDNPGVRVYAWRRTEGLPSHESHSASVRTRQGATLPATAGAANPHWTAQSCSTCHAMEDQRPGAAVLQNERAVAIDSAGVNRQCLSCHDGEHASSEPHPIGRPATTDWVQTPADWPTVDGRIGCLTCHDIRRHCDRDARRPAENPAMLRGFNPGEPTDFCLQCHKWEDAWRFNPHEQVDSKGRINDAACLFCHSRTPAYPVDRRWFQPRLRAGGSELCMTCHAKHWDYFSEGHVDFAVPDSLRRRMPATEHVGRFQPAAEGPAAPADRAATGASDPPRRTGEADSARERPRDLPLDGDRIRCYTCHNPHEPGLFEPDSELGMVASAPADAAISLRMNYAQLCLTCHKK